MFYQKKTSIRYVDSQKTKCNWVDFMETMNKREKRAYYNVKVIVTSKNLSVIDLCIYYVFETYTFQYLWK